MKSKTCSWHGSPTPPASHSTSPLCHPSQRELKEVPHTTECLRDAQGLRGGGCSRPAKMWREKREEGKCPKEEEVVSQEGDSEQWDCDGRLKPASRMDVKFPGMLWAGCWNGLCWEYLHSEYWQLLQNKAFLLESWLTSTPLPIPSRMWCYCHC